MGVDDDPGGWGRADWYGMDPPDFIPPNPEAEDLATFIAHELRDLNPEISRAQTGSIYIRFYTNLRLGSLRIADHPGRERWRYKWNLLDAPGQPSPEVINDDGVQRRFYTWQDADLLIADIRRKAHPTLPKGESMKKIGDRLPAKKRQAETEEPDPFDEDPEFPGTSVHTSHTRSRSGQADEQLPSEHTEQPRVRLVEADEPHSEVEVSINAPGKSVRIDVKGANKAARMMVPATQNTSHVNISTASQSPTDRERKTSWLLPRTHARKPKRNSTKILSPRWTTPSSPRGNCSSAMGVTRRPRWTWTVSA